MRSRRFLQALVLTLALPVLTYAAARGENAKMSRPADARHSPFTITELGRLPGGPGKSERFIVKTLETGTPASEDASAAKEEEVTEVAPPGDDVVLPGKVNLSIPAQPLFSHSSPRLTLIDKTYLDAYSILRERNACSNFFGGPRAATDVLNSLHPILKSSSLPENNIGIRMSGPATFVKDFQTGLSYRLFKQAVVNLTGPFYLGMSFRTQEFFRRMGNYSANTREARVAMLLHELGHLLPGADGRWLLPDDGGDSTQTAANTATILEKCSEQIDSLSRSDDTPALGAADENIR